MSGQLPLVVYITSYDAPDVPFVTVPVIESRIAESLGELRNVNIPQ